MIWPQNTELTPTGISILQRQLTSSLATWTTTAERITPPREYKVVGGELLPPFPATEEGVEAWMLEPIVSEYKPVGMYGETPRVNIGKFSICRQDDSSVWIQIEGEEGFQLQDSIMEAHMQEIFDKRF